MGKYNTFHDGPSSVLKKTLPTDYVSDLGLIILPCAHIKSTIQEIKY